MSHDATAIVDPLACVHPSAQIGPYCIVGPHVTIGADCRLLSHVVVHQHTTLGERNIVHPFACLGGEPQDLKYHGELARLVIGDDNTIRENVTINIGTAGGDLQTTIGNNCLLMAYSHVAHDCRLGNAVVLANGATLAGHVDVDDDAIVGGLSAIHQFCRIGRYAFIGGGAMVAQDIPPFCIAQGDRAELAGINAIGLKRAGWQRGLLSQIYQAYQLLFCQKKSREQALAEVFAKLNTTVPELQELCNFIRHSQRGICKARRAEVLQPQQIHVA